ncbi:MAG TPA: hypothetical protein VLB76_25500 [Thermoanaerobaculia bacterium]|jgi:hypothetical protein|nr:hypothetical protein [Thermoanaerobaculia bacterium]
MSFVSRDLMVNVLYGMSGEGDEPGCTPSPAKCTPSPPDRNCTPSPPDGDCTPSPPANCTPSPVTGYGEDESPLKALASLRQQLRETLAQA